MKSFIIFVLAAFLVLSCTTQREYQFDVNKDLSIDLYSRHRYVGHCQANKLDSLILFDNQ